LARRHTHTAHGTKRLMVRTAPAPLLALCLLAIWGCADAAAHMTEHPGSFAGKTHGEAFMGFMARHGKDYCGGGHTRACEISMLR